MSTVKRTIFGTSLLVPDNTIVEVWVEGLVQGFYHEGTPIFDLSIVVKLSHANFDRVSRRFTATLLFLGDTPFGQPRELKCAVNAIMAAFRGVADLILDAYQNADEITHHMLQEFFKKNYKKCKGGNFILARRR